ncbi:IS1/IS1595 family N-terminal zinc-binding domain-containing protein [Nostoc sp.]
MKCPRCESTLYGKNGRRNDKQNYLCKNCGKWQGI